jgi:transaldolase
MQKEKNMFVLEVKPEDFGARLEGLRKDLKKETNDKKLEELSEISLDLQSYLLNWNLQNLNNKGKLISDEEILEQVQENYSLLERLNYGNGVIKIKEEAEKIKLFNMYKLSLKSDQGLMNNRWGNNDGAGLKNAMRKGVVLVTTNPQIINSLRKRFPEYWNIKKQEIKEMYKDFSLEQIVARVTAEAVLESARLLRPVYKNGDKNMGYVSFQLNPNLADNSMAMITDAMMIYKWLKEGFDGEDPNVVFKVPGTFAGLETAKELTSKGIGINVTVNYSVAQQLAFGEIIESGNAKHCYLTQMNLRLEEPIAEELGEGNCDSPNKISSWSSTAVTRRAYKILYKERGYKKSVLLGASINKPWHVQRAITNGNDPVLHMTISPEAIEKFDYELSNLSPCITEEIEKGKLEKLLQSDTFRKAYEIDYLKPKDFDTFKPTLKTLNGFKENYNEFSQWCKE